MITLPLSLIPYPNIDPVIVRLGPLQIRWYGVAYLTGFIIAYFILNKLAKQRVLRMDAERLGDLVGWLALGVIVGGRSGWWIFYRHNMGPVEHWWEPFAIQRGGMSFHGGLAGVMIVLFIWCKIQKLSFLNLADCLALVTPVGLFLGRLANFINGELFGRPTDLPWAMIFPTADNQPRHPSQLYEALLEGPLLMAILWLFKQKKTRRDGQIASMFVIAYGIIRFCVEFTREPDPQLGYIAWNWLTMGQLLSFAIFAAGLIWYLVLSRQQPTPIIEPKQTAKRSK